MNLRTHTLAPTTIIDLPSPVNETVSPKSGTGMVFTMRSAAVSDAPAYPYLSRMINKAQGISQKKVVFDRSDYDDLLG